MTYKTITQLLEDKVILVTGAGSGIGRVCAIAFAAAGAKVIVSDYAEEAGLETLTAMEKNGGQGIFVRANVADETEVESMISNAVDTPMANWTAL